MGRELPGHTLQAKALVNEAYLRLMDWKSVRWQNRRHFFDISAPRGTRIAPLPQDLAPPVWHSPECRTLSYARAPTKPLSECGYLGVAPAWPAADPFHLPIPAGDRGPQSSDKCPLEDQLAGIPRVAPAGVDIFCQTQNPSRMPKLIYRAG